MKLITGLLLLFLLVIGSAKSQNNNSVYLFKPEDRSQWYVFLEGSEKGKDPLGVFQFENGMIHVSGQKFGYIATKNFIPIFILNWNLNGVRKNILPG